MQEAGDVAIPVAYAGAYLCGFIEKLSYQRRWSFSQCLSVSNQKFKGSHVVGCSPAFAFLVIWLSFATGFMKCHYGIKVSGIVSEFHIGLSGVFLEVVRIAQQKRRKKGNHKPRSPDPASMGGNYCLFCLWVANNLGTWNQPTKAPNTRLSLPHNPSIWSNGILLRTQQDGRLLPSGELQTADVAARQVTITRLRAEYSKVITARLSSGSCRTIAD